MIKTDCGSESISKVMDNYERRVAIDFSRPRNPTDKTPASRVSTVACASA